MKIREYIPFLVGQFTAIDGFKGQGLDRPRSPEFKTNVAALVGALVLFCNSFFVIGGPASKWVQKTAIDLILRLPEGDTRALMLDVSSIARHAYWSLGCLFFYFVVPVLVIKLLFRERLSEFGFSPRGFFKHLPIYLLLFVPVIAGTVFVSYSDSFLKTYPFYHNPHYVWDMLLWDFLYCVQFFGLEFFFRGFMVHSMKHRLGSSAIWVMVIPYLMIHFGKPAPEAFGAIIAGTVLGVLSLRTNSIWGGVFIHCMVAISMDWLSLWHRGALPWML